MREAERGRPAPISQACDGSAFVHAALRPENRAATRSTKRGDGAFGVLARCLELQMMLSRAARSAITLTMLLASIHRPRRMRECDICGCEFLGELGELHRRPRMQPAACTSRTLPVMTWPFGLSNVIASSIDPLPLAFTPPTILRPRL